MLPARDTDHTHATPLGALREFDRHGGGSRDAEDHEDVLRAEGEVREHLIGEPRDALDEHGLPLAVGADDLSVEGGGELDHRAEAREGTVAREHLLDRHPRVPTAEGVDEAAGLDRVRGPRGRRRDRRRLGALDLTHQLDRAFGPAARHA